MVLKTRGAPLLALSLTWLAFALRVVGLDYQSLWRDEVDALRFASRPLVESLATFARHGENGPLFFLGLRSWLVAAGRSEFALRFPSAWMGTLAVPVIYVLIRRLTGVRPALIAALLAATAPYLIWYGQDAKMYAALTLIVPLSLWLTVEAAQRGGLWRWLLLYLLTTLCFYIHLLAVLVVPVQALWLLIAPRGGPPARRWVTMATYLTALLLPYLPLLRWQSAMWLSPFETGHPFVPLGDILAVLAVAYSRGVLGAGAPVSLLPTLVALLAGFGLWAAKPSLRSGPFLSNGLEQTAGPSLADRWRVVAMLGIWLLLPPVAAYAISLRVPVFTDRYLIWCAPAFLGLASLGIVALARVWRPLGAVVLAAMMVTGLAGVWAQSSQPVKSDFRAATRFVLDHWRPGDLLIFQIPHGRYAFAYYSNAGVPEEPSATGELRWMDGPFTNNGAELAAVDDQMKQAAIGSQAAWLIASEAPMWDQRELTRAWLAENGSVTDRADFVRVSVTRYELKR